MGRKLVVCLDGTDNKYAATNTNVVKLFAMVDRTKGDQLGYYQTGIGTMAPPGVWYKIQRWWMTRLDLAIAWLLEDHVCDAYRFLMQNYQEGDEIFVFGFSRGAYSARVLAAMLYKVGLLGTGNEELVPFAWDTFAREMNKDMYTGFRHTFARRVEVAFLGVWDTVSSVGWLWDPKHYQFTRDNPIVKTFRHAVSLDERRAKFRQNLWKADPPTGQDVLEVWFPGVHCDVGGGYKEEEAGLSKIALQWMVREAKAAGLRFQPKAVEEWLPSKSTQQSAAPDPLARAHESLSGLWWIVEIMPKLDRDPRRNFEPHWIIPLGRSRYVADGAKIHEAVFERKSHRSDYDPPNLPPTFTRVT